MTRKLKNLLIEVRSCTLCEEHLPSGPRPILQVNSRAKILIAGQAPGRKVHETGIPFDDPGGERLRDWLGVDNNVFYDETKIALLPMGFCFLGSGKSGDLPPRPECADAWREKLLSSLPEIELTILIGQYAQKYHLGVLQKKNLTETVLSWKGYWKKGLLPLPHPSPRNNIWLQKNSWFENDILPTLKLKVQRIIGSKNS
jgi:uracil-DNA glycosylase